MSNRLYEQAIHNNPLLFQQSMPPFSANPVSTLVCCPWLSILPSSTEIPASCTNLTSDWSCYQTLLCRSLDVNWKLLLVDNSKDPSNTHGFPVLATIQGKRVCIRAPWCHLNAAVQLCYSAWLTLLTQAHWCGSVTSSPYS